MANEERETVTLIGSDKVEGTAVYGADDAQIGSIERVMIDKRSGKVSYAVLSFGGFLGIGDDHYPLPWNSLRYDTNLGDCSQRSALKRLHRLDIHSIKISPRFLWPSSVSTAANRRFRSTNHGW